MDLLAQLRLALQQFGSDPVRWGHLMRDLYAHDPAAFRQAAVDLLGSFEDTGGYTFLLRLLASHDLIVPSLLEIARQDKAHLDAVITATQRVCPLLQANLGDYMSRCPDNLDAEQERLVLRGFLLIDSFSSKLNNLRLLRRLLASANGRIRSKAAIMISKYTDSQQSMAELLTDEDSRVRANAIEALWKADSAVSVPIYRVAALDPSSRVAANALVGLYLAGHIQALSSLHAMARQESPRIRASAAWAMGRTGDRRFVPCLKSLINDSDPLVRSNAIRAAIQIRKNSGTKISDPPELVVVQTTADLIRFVCEVGTNDARPINPLKVRLHIEDNPVLNYSVEQWKAPERKAIAVIVPNSLGDRREFVDSFRKATLSRRPDDTWAVLGYHPTPSKSAMAEFDAVEDTARPSGNQAAWLRDVAALQRAFADPNPIDNSPAPLWNAVLSCARRMRSMRFERHIVLLIPNPETVPGTEEALKAAGELLLAEKIVIHAVLPNQLSPHLQAVRRLSLSTGGLVPATQSEAALDAVLRALASHLVLRYDAEPQSGSAVLQIESESGLSTVDLSIPDPEAANN